MQHELGFVGAVKRVDILLIFAGAECRYNQRLGFTTRKQRRTMGAWQNGCFSNDLTDCLGITAINAVARVKNVVTDNILLKILEGFRDFLCRWRIFLARINESGNRLVLGLRDSFLTLFLFRNRISCTEIFLNRLLHGLVKFVIVIRCEITGLARRTLSETNDCINDRLKARMAKHHGTKHLLFRKFLGF